jgi:hypothetical protein
VDFGARHGSLTLGGYPQRRGCPLFLYKVLNTRTRTKYTMWAWVLGSLGTTLFKDLCECV